MTDKSPRVLLDTHVLLWWIADDPRLSKEARRVIEDGNREVLVSAASTWEIAIKYRIGKLDLSDRPEVFIAEQMHKNNFLPLAISLSHSLYVSKLPTVHSDPFDHLLIAQCLLERLPIITADENMRQYKLKTIW